MAVRCDACGLMVARRIGVVQPDGSRRYACVACIEATAPALEAGVWPGIGAAGELYITRTDRQLVLAVFGEEGEGG